MIEMAFKKDSPKNVEMFYQVQTYHEKDCFISLFAIRMKSITAFCLTDLPMNIFWTCNTK